MSQTIVVTEFLSLDGVMESPQDWNISYVEETLGADVQSELDRATGLLYGRTTFEGMAAAWPTRTGPAADRFNGLPKYVVSNTLTESSWSGTTILAGDGGRAVSALKASGEGRLLIWGSRRLVHSLAAAGLVDEYVLYVHPLVLGKGARFFAEGLPEKFELTGTKTYARGVIGVRLRPLAK